MRYKFLFIIFFLIGQCYAQQEPHFTIFWNNYSLYNPAATGLFNKHFASLNGRLQWVNFNKAPKTISAVYDFKWEKINSGIGINYIYDQLGFEKNNKINLTYSYQFNLKKDRVLSSGVSFGILRKSIDYSKFITIDSNDPLLNSNTVQRDDLFNINFGLMFKSPHFLFGLSATQLNESESKILHLKNSRHYYFVCSYNTNAGKNFNIKPIILIKSDIVSTQYDINLLLTYKKRIWTGVSYRIDDAIAFMGGADIKGKYRIGYSYDYTISAFANYSNGSHEVVMALMLK